MCGIFAYKGEATNAHQVVLQGLQRLEYRGYDSAGMMVGHAHDTAVYKAVGKVSDLANKTLSMIDPGAVYSYGIGHTRWATHGGVTVENCHPHQDHEGLFTLVHNGIIENYQKLKSWLIDQGYEFVSATDTEVIVNLLHANRNGDFLATVEKVLPMLHGAYALLIFCREKPDEMIGMRLGSPLVFGKGKDATFYFSSDTQALAGVADQVIYLEDGELVHVAGGHYTLKAQGREIFKNLEVLDVASLEASKGSYTHFMLKEIEEQPNVIKRLFKGRVNFADHSLTSGAMHGLQCETFQRVVLVGCGTSYYACWLGSYWLQNLAGMDAIAEIANVYENKRMLLDEETLHVLVSQSGETADTMGVLQELLAHDAATFGVVNVVGSTISRLTDYGFFMRAGSEIGVASTKAFVAASVLLLIFSLWMGHRRGLQRSRFVYLLEQLHDLPDLLEQVLAQQPKIKMLAKELAGYQHCFFLGRRYMLPVAYEASLKFKEITYIHSEAYPAAELKHGPLALIDEDCPVVLLAPDDMMFGKNMSSLKEVQARKGKVLVVSDREVPDADWQLTLPSCCEELYPIVATVSMQLLAYHTAAVLERDIDKPRNLAKSVTVK